jgi:hypothetical protein
LRPEVAPGSEEPTLLFPGETDAFGTAALIACDELYAYSCESEDGWGKPCKVARVSLDSVLEQDAWRFYDGSGWVAELEKAKSVFEGNSQLTVHYNAFLGRYLAVHVDGVSDNVVLRTAPAPEGPWSEAVKAFKAEPAAGDSFVYCGLGHDELQREDGRLELVSYYRSTGDWTGEIRLVELELDQK